MRTEIIIFTLLFISFLLGFAIGSACEKRYNEVQNDSCKEYTLDSYLSAAGKTK